MNGETGGELRRRVSERANWQCEYCLLHEDDAFTPHQIDHIISRKHGGVSTADNLALACLRCNAWKGSDIAGFGFDRQCLVPLFHPRRQRWVDHFLLRGALIEPVTDTGEATARLLRLNQAARVNERRLLIQCGRYPRIRRS